MFLCCTEYINKFYLNFILSEYHDKTLIASCKYPRLRPKSEQAKLGHFGMTKTEGYVYDVQDSVLSYHSARKSLVSLRN